MTKRVEVWAVAAAVPQAAACVDQPAAIGLLDGPTQLMAPSLSEGDGSRIRSTATVTLMSVSGAKPAVLFRESAPVEGIVRSGSAMAGIRLGRGSAPSVERIPLVRSRAKRRSFSESEKDEAGRDLSVVVEELPNGTSRTEIWRDLELLARVTYEYRGASGHVRQIVQESFAHGKAVTRLEIALTDSRVVDAGDADATAQVAAMEAEHASAGAEIEAGEVGRFMAVATVARGCYWRTLALLVEAAGVGAACGAAITTAIVTAGVSVTACAVGGSHLLGALEDWQEDCAPAAT